ncbi:TraR/DksA family transcriptional regulator [Falsiroseomonas tokyonensis]|uniref:TraR/DksA family transcriptional regulator n=1 Tax=Falsiroseomonas tokyonensis TaxID=430521 RepID=A0ABV7C5D4_9PROT|nr:TraR/DksA family transcriptional regulator [Falsiroseomonas tokyonensis]
MNGNPADAPPGVDVMAMKQRLLAERAALGGISAASAQSREAVTLDQTSVGRLSRMDAMQQQAMALATERRRAGTLARIEAALVRIEAGEFGWCVHCGEPIAPGRLALDPAIAHCVTCASR